MDSEKIMKKYNEKLKEKIEAYDRIYWNEWGGDFFYEKHLEVRENLQKTAMECINSVLSPELKIFLKNLCSNKLGYPDEVIFYKAFGENPEIGKSVSREELEQKGIDIKNFENMLDYWFWEGNVVTKYNSEGTDYYCLDSLCERANITSEEEKERLNSSVELKLAIINMQEDDDKKDRYIELVDDLLLGITPQRLKNIKRKKAAKKLLEFAEKHQLTFPKECSDFLKSIL